MTHPVDILPCRPQNSIDSMGIILYFKDPLPLGKEHLDMMNANKQLKSLFDKIYGQENSRGNKIFFEKFDSPEKILWKIELANTYIRLLHKDYRRWEYSVDFCNRFFRSIDLFDNTAIEVVFLGYLDVFFVKDVKEFNYSMLYKENEYIPGVFFGNYFVDIDVSVPAITGDKSVVRTNIKLSANAVYGDKKSIEYHKLKCDLSSHKFVKPFDFVDMFKSGDLFKVHLTPMHNDLNSLFKKMIQEEIQRKVGMEV